MTQKPTLSDVSTAYLQINRRIEPLTIDLTQRAFRYLTAAVGDVPVVNFQLGHAERFQAYLSDAGLGPASANIYVKTVRPVFRWAMRRDWIGEDPFANLNLFRVPKQRIRVFEGFEWDAMFEAARSPIWRARLMLAKTAGLRRGEVLNLTVDDVDFDHGLIHVQAKKDTLHTWQWHVKDKDRRMLPLVEPLSDLLIRILEALPTGQPYLTLTHQRYRRLMHLKNAGQMSDRLRVCPDENFSTPFRRLLRRAGVKSGTFHDLRRTCITEWLEAGLKPHEVMTLAGHSNIDTTMRYYVATRRELLDKARRASQDLLGPSEVGRVTSKSQTVIGATGLEPATS